ncbi:MAG: hypothetical protein Q7S95_03620 [bacterium]|nr:hypothetical protein [bacterium]
MKRMKYPVIIGVLCVSIAVMGLYASGLSHPVAKDITENSSAGWFETIKRQGPDKAYALFKQKNDTRSQEEVHVDAHVFGKALYRAEGVQGVTVCDSAYGFGCYHQFFLSAIADKGLSVVKELDDACVAKFGLGGQGCQHGIGHGVFEYLAQSLPKALDVCGTMQWQEPLFGCQGGVFMEYNFPTFIEATGSRPQARQFDQSHPYEPCPAVALRFRLACYYAQTEWWDKGTSLNYREMGELCAAIREKDFREICFKAIGYSAVSANGFKLDKAVTACGAMPDADSLLLCRSGVLWGFWDSGTIYRRTALQACSDLGEPLASRCKQEADLLHEGINWSYQ